MAPDSPAMAAKYPERKRFSPAMAAKYPERKRIDKGQTGKMENYKGNMRHKGARVNNINMESHPSRSDKNSCHINLELPTDVIKDLDNANVPENSFDKELFYKYHAYLYRIQSEPFQTKCIVCGGMHRFDNCEVLANTSFLRSHYIRYCQMMNKDTSIRETAVSDKQKVNAVDVANEMDFVNECELSDSNSSSDSSNTEDFQTGRA